MPPSIVSVNIARPTQFNWRGRWVRTGIFKEPVLTPVPVYRLGLEGDLQADLNVHGGPRKAVYGYPAAHYDAWRQELPGVDMPFGFFGENLTIEGLDETGVHLGDRFRAGTAVLEITQPREPCYKLGAKFGNARMIQRFRESGRSGFYFSVVEEGSLQAGDIIELAGLGDRGISIAEMNARA